MPRWSGRSCASARTRTWRLPVARSEDSGVPGAPRVVTRHVVSRCEDVAVLDWNELDPLRFERVVQMLVERAFGATSIDGSGGDLAQDLRWDSPDGLVIFEVKSFKGTLTANQKKKVRASLLKAVGEHQPAKWVLITRSNPRTPELGWLQEQGRQVGVAVQWLGRGWLDIQIAGRDDLVAYVEGADSKLLRRAKQFDQERSALASGDDLTARIHALDKLGESLSPFWRWDISTSGGKVIQTLQSRRNDAADLDPITLTPTFAFPREDPDAMELAERLRSFLEDGGEGISVPGRLVQSWDVVTASDATARLLGCHDRPPDRIELVGIPDTSGLPVAVTIRRESPVGSSDIQVFLKQRFTGAQGMTLVGSDASDALDVRLVLRQLQQGTSDSLTISLRPPQGRLPHEVASAIAWMTGHSPDANLVLKVGPNTIAAFDAGPTPTQDLVPLQRLVSALIVLQDHLGELIPLPTELPATEEVNELFQIARALRGEQVPQRYDGLNATVKPGKLRDFLDALPADAGAIYVTQTVELELSGRSFVISGLALWAPAIELANRQELEALSIDITEHTARFKALDDKGIFLIRAVEEPGEPWMPVLSLGE